MPSAARDDSDDPDIRAPDEDVNVCGCIMTVLQSAACVVRAGVRCC